MSVSLVKNLGRLISMLTLVAAVGVGYWGTLPPEVERFVSPRPQLRMHSVPSPPDIPRYASLAPLVDQRLRGPLYDPPPIPPPVIPPPAPIRVNLKLVGTVLEPGRNQALLADSQGKVLFCRVGETIASQPGGILLESVTATDAVLRVTTPRESMLTLSIEGDSPN